jgi:hypothetical protein
MMASCLRHSPIIDRAGTHGLCILPKLSIMHYQMQTCWAAAKSAMFLFSLAIQKHVDSAISGTEEAQCA